LNANLLAVSQSIGILAVQPHDTAPQNEKDFSIFPADWVVTAHRVYLAAHLLMGMTSCALAA
jgi:hypothetical protein